MSGWVLMDNGLIVVAAGANRAAAPAPSQLQCGFLLSPASSRLWKVCLCICMPS